MKTTKGIIAVSVWVECPHCSHDFDALEHDDDDSTLLKIALSWYGTWRLNDAIYELQCPECCNDFMIFKLEL